EIVELEQPEKMVFAQTLVSLPFAGRLGGTVSVLMPRYITPDRQATWQQYGVVRRPAVWPRDPEEDDEDDDAPPTLQFADDRFDLWADPAAPPIGRHLRGYEFHRFVPATTPVA
ncbi:MAG: hypothetical protein NZ518_07430, partial [Dehalococcoidia bacterium]|nr:hypothetical protein [Dehalococcoidia bacterium]